jgi:hypothetical protein
MSKQSSALQKIRIPKPIRAFGRKIGEEAIELGRDVKNIQELMRNKRRRFEMGGLPKNAFDYENEFLQTVDDSIKRRLKFRYGKAIKPWIGLGGISYAQSQSNPTTKKRLKKGLVNPVLHEIRQANPAPTRRSIKYAPSSYSDSVQGMTGQGRQRNSNELRQLRENASTLATGGRPNPEHNAKRFHGMFGVSAINEPQKSMTKLQLAQREINQSMRSGQSNRRIAKSSITKGSYSNSFVSGSAVDPNMIVQPKKGRRFKGQTMGMTLVSKRAKSLSKNTVGDKPDPKDGDALLSDLLSSTNTAPRTIEPTTRVRSKSTPWRRFNHYLADIEAGIGNKSKDAWNALLQNKSTTAPASSRPKSKSTPWRQFKRQLANIETGVVNTSKDVWNTSKNVWNTYNPKSTAPAPTTTWGKVKSVGGKIFPGIGYANTFFDAATSLGSITGGAKASLYEKAPNKTIAGKPVKDDYYVVNATNPLLTSSNVSGYQKPIQVVTERYDVPDIRRQYSPDYFNSFFGRPPTVEDIRAGINADYMATAFTATPSGELKVNPPSSSEYASVTNPNKTIGYGDSDAYRVASIEDIPDERIKQEQGRFGFPVEVRMRSTDATAKNSAWQEAINLVDPTGLSSGVMGVNTYADYGEPVLGGKTMYRTSLINSIGNVPTSYVTGWAKSSSANGLPSLSAKGAIKFHKDKYKKESELAQQKLNETKTEISQINSDITQANQQIKDINDNITRLQLMWEDMQPEEGTEEEQYFIDAYKDLSSNLANLESNVSIYQDDLKRYENNKNVFDTYYNDLTKNVTALSQMEGRVDSYADLESEIDNARSNGNKYIENLLTKPINLDGSGEDMAALYAMAGYQNPLRRIQIARVGDKYGTNIVPYSIRSDVPQTVRYNEPDLSPGQSAGSMVASFAGVTPYGKVKQSDIDNDWYIGAGLSNYRGNDPKYKNINTQAVYVDEDPRVSATHQPINPATGKPVDNRSLGVIISSRGKNLLQNLGSIVNPETYSPGFWQNYLPYLTQNNVSKRKSTKQSRQSVAQKSAVKKSSLKPSSLMSPMGDAPKAVVKQNDASSSLVKSLNPNPKPIQPVTAKHNNKYFK